MLPPELVAYWKFNETEGIIAYDIAKGNDGYIIGDPVWLSDGGKKDGALQLISLESIKGLIGLTIPVIGLYCKILTPIITRADCNILCCYIETCGNEVRNVSLRRC